MNEDKQAGRMLPPDSPLILSWDERQGRQVVIDTGRRPLTEYEKEVLARSESEGRR